MKLLLKILGVIAVLILLLALVSFFFPRYYKVERSAVFGAKPDVVHAQITHLRAWKNWGIWMQRDPGMTITYSEADTGVGAWSAWVSAKEGSGKMTIAKLSPTEVVYALEFPDFGTKSTGTMKVVPEGAGTRVVWSDEGDLGMNPMNRWFGLFLEKLLGGDFEQSLTNLRKIVEK